MKNLKFFEQHTQYATYINSPNPILPNVSYCVDNNEVHYNPIDYSKTYLTFEALESGTISFNIWGSMGTDMITSISYSTDNGTTWTTTNNTDNKSEHLQISVDVNTGDKVLWKGTATQTGFFDEDDYYDFVGSFFSSDCEFNAYGNVMSLLYGDNFVNQTSLNDIDGIFTYLFSDYDENESCQIVSAENLSLPATTLANSCYKVMFKGCTALTIAPTLPATTLASGCYMDMFRDCTSLTTAPVLPSTTLAESCYRDMFYNCTSLTTAPVLPSTTLANSCYLQMFYGCTSLTTTPVLLATTLANHCYSYMFANCTSLTTTPELNATTLANNCYNGMFYGCTSLTTAPALNATTLADSCYSFMFSDCTALTTAPALPATTLTQECYGHMFSDCTSLITAPVLPATTLVTQCYNQMFNGCTNLNYIKALFTTAPSDTYTARWVKNVALTGTFVKNSTVSWTTTGVNAIPSGWTVQTASE